MFLSKSPRLDVQNLKDEIYDVIQIYILNDVAQFTSRVEIYGSTSYFGSPHVGIVFHALKIRLGELSGYLTASLERPVKFLELYAILQ